MGIGQRLCATDIGSDKITEYPVAERVAATNVDARCCVSSDEVALRGISAPDGIVSGGHEHAVIVAQWQHPAGVGADKVALHQVIAPELVVDAGPVVTRNDIARASARAPNEIGWPWN